MPFDFKKECKEYYMPPKKPTIVTVPQMNYIAVRGEGDPNAEGGEYKQALEFATGCVVNLWLGLDVWDYSQKPFNLLGQISLGSSVAWYFLSAVGIILDDCLRFRFFGEAEPWYRLI